MNNLVEFGRMFLSYGVLILIIAAVGGAAITIGITMAKKEERKGGSRDSGRIGFPKTGQGVLIWQNRRDKS